MNTEPIINGHAIYTTKGAALEYGRIGCNFYKGCPHGCTYCYLKRGAPSKQLGGNEAVLKKCFKDEFYAIRTLEKELDKHHDACRKHGIFLSFSTDPLIEETRHLTVAVIKAATLRNTPVCVLTKDATFIHDAAIMQYLSTINIYDRRDLVQFGFTLTGRDDMEPNASSNHDRIKAMRHLHDLGFKTFASVEPVIDWTHAHMVVTMSLDCCDHYKIGLRSGVKKDYYDLDESGTAIRDLTEHITAAGRAVYLKESTRTLLRRCFVPEECDRILSLTIDMDGKPWKSEKS